LGDINSKAGKLTEARRFYELAATGGDPTAMLKLAVWSRDGIGGPTDKVAAVRWFLSPLNYANANGVHDAIQVAKGMTDDEIWEATELSGRREDGRALIEVARKNR
jgi:hypothetical protein